MVSLVSGGYPPDPHVRIAGRLLRRGRRWRSLTGKDPRSRPHGSLTSGKERRPTLVGLALALALAMAVPATASHLSDWKHDHSPQAIRHRPHGLAELVDRYGGHCSNKANDARTWFPSAVARHVGGYVTYHAKLARNVGYNIRTHIAADHRNPAIDYGVYGYNCRLKRGGTQWSTHAFGVAIDTNTFRNPFGQAHWDGRGSNGHDFGRYLPNIYKGPYPGHRFFWGKKWNDPHHFQYVTGY
jgi:hypothetical protein